MKIIDLRINRRIVFVGARHTLMGQLRAEAGMVPVPASSTATT